MYRGVVVALLVVLAGCGAAGPGATSTEGGTVTPVPVPTDPTPEPELYPPGVTPDGIDASTLAATTERSLNGTAFSFRLDRRQARPERSLGTLYVGPRLEVDAAADDRYLLNRTTVSERGGGFMIETFRGATYVRGERATVKGGEDVTVRPVEPDEQTPPATRAARLVRRYLAVENATVERSENGTAVVRGYGTPLPNVSQYSVTAVVANDGTVTRFDAVFVRNEHVWFVRFRLDRDASFEPPEWAAGATG